MVSRDIIHYPINMNEVEQVLAPTSVKQKYGHSRPDFIAKLQIALKECYETEYWIEIAQKADIISVDSTKSILHDCGAIRRILIPSINTAKENAK